MRLVTAHEMRAIDRATIDGGHVPALALMENAGRGIAARVEAMVPRGAMIQVVCGRGNNGGDGLVVARLLASRGFRLVVQLTHRAADLSPDARTNLERLQREAPHVTVNVLPDDLGDPSPLRAALRDADLCIDALLG